VQNNTQVLSLTWSSSVIVVTT